MASALQFVMKKPARCLQCGRSREEIVEADDGVRQPRAVPELVGLGSASAPATHAPRSQANRASRDQGIAVGGSGQGRRMIPASPAGTLRFDRCECGQADGQAELRADPATSRTGGTHGRTVTGCDPGSEAIIAVRRQAMFWAGSRRDRPRHHSRARRRQEVGTSGSAHCGIHRG